MSRSTLLDRNGGNNMKSVELRILEKEVRLGCKPGEEDELARAAAYIDKSMRDLRLRNTTSSLEKIAIVAAINTAAELLKARSRKGVDTDSEERIAALNQQIEAMLNDDVTA